MFVRVLPDQAAGRLLDYRVPESMKDSIGVGSRVRVPVRTRMLTGTVIEVLATCEFNSVKDVSQLLDEKPMIRPALLELARWMADYYCCPLETAVCSVLPVAVRDGRVSVKKQNSVRLVAPIAEEQLEALARKAPRQADALRVLIKAGRPLPVTTAADQAGVSDSVYRTLEKNGFVVIESTVVGRNPYSERFVANAEPRPDGTRARSRNRTHPANGGTFQIPVCGHAGPHCRSSQPPLRRGTSRRMAQNPRRIGAHCDRSEKLDFRATGKSRSHHRG